MRLPGRTNMLQAGADRLLFVVFMEQHFMEQHLLTCRLPTTSDLVFAVSTAETQTPQWLASTHSTYRQDHAVLEIGKFTVTLLTAV